MKVSLAERGGIGAALRMGAAPRTIDATTLPAAAQATLKRLLDAAVAAPAPAGPGAARDAISYAITVEAGGAPLTLRQTDATMTDAFAALLDWVHAHLPD